MNQYTESAPQSQVNPRLEGRPALGEICLIKAIARKRRTWLHGKQITEWVQDPFTSEPFRAMYVGWRVVRNIERPGDADGMWESGFEITRSLYVWLFVKDERSAPFYVFCRDVERIAHDANGGQG